MQEVYIIQDLILEDPQVCLETCWEIYPHLVLEDFCSDSDPKKASDLDSGSEPSLCLDTEVTYGATSQPQENIPDLSLSRQARRRRISRKQKTKPQLSRKESLARGRVAGAFRNPVQTDISISNLKPGLKLDVGDVKVYELQELKKMGFRVIEWDGV